MGRRLDVRIIKMRKKGRQRRYSRSVVNQGQPYDQKILNRQAVNAVRDIAQDIRDSMNFVMTDRMVEVCTPVLQRRDLSMRTCIFNGRTIKTYIFFDIGLKNIFVMEFNLRLDIVRRSVQFNTLVQAQDVYASGNTPWL